jgi:hypothetical protein
MAGLFLAVACACGQAPMVHPRYRLLVVEMRFAHMKRILKLDRLRLRGLSGAKDDVLLTATAQNLRRLAKLLRCAPPAPVACLAGASCHAWCQGFAQWESGLN